MRGPIPTVLLLIGLTALARADTTFSIGGSARDYAWAAASAGDGGLFLVGSFVGEVDFDPGPGSTRRRADPGTGDLRRRFDAFLARYGPQGEFRWVRTIGGSGMNLARAVRADGRGGVYVSGNFAGRVDFDPDDGMDDEDTLQTGAGRNAFLAHYDADGTFLWVRGFGDDDVAPPGARGNVLEGAEGIRGIAVDAEDNVYAAGLFSGRIALDPTHPEDTIRSVEGWRDVFLASFDAAGTYRWGRTYGGPGRDQGHALAVGPRGALVLGGCFEGAVSFAGRREGRVEATGLADAFLLFLTTDGAFRNVVAWGGHGEDQVSDGGLALRDGHVYAVGNFTGHTDFDPGRRRVRRRSQGSSDAFLTCFDLDARFRWVAAFGGNGNDAALAVCLPRDGGVAVGGRFTGTVDFEAGRAKRRIESRGRAGATDAFVARFDERGGLDWVRTLGAPVRDPRQMTRTVGLAPGPDGRVVAAGTFYDRVTLDPDDADVALLSRGDADVFVVTYDTDGEVVVADSHR